MYITPMRDDVLQPMLCVNNNLHRTARTVTRIYAEEFAPLGIKRAQFGILAALNMMGEAGIAELAERLDMERSTASRTVKPLQKKRFVKAKVSTLDGRAKVLALTRAGQDLYDRAFVLWQRAQTRIVETFGEERWLSLNRDLESLRRAARRA